MRVRPVTAAIPGVTGNAQLLLGYIAGAVAEDYQALEANGTEGTAIVEHVRTGNKFRVSVEQIEGIE